MSDHPQSSNRSRDTGSARLDALRSRVRFGQFVSVGAVGFVCDTIVLTTTHLVLGWPELWGKIAAAETAILVMFIVNEHWTFADHGSPGRESFARRMFRSHLVRASGTTIQITLYWILTSMLSITVVFQGIDWWFLLASFVAISMAMFVNYVFESLFTWRVHLDDGADR